MEYLTFAAADPAFFSYKGKVAFFAPEDIIIFIFKARRGFFL
jgi:hypothetical protein